MTTTRHPYLDEGITILKTRISATSGQVSAPSRSAVLPFITLSREACAGATVLGQALVPLLNEQLGDAGRSWIFFDRDLITHALIKQQLPERLAEFLPEDRISEIKALVGELVGLHPPVWELENKVSEAILQLARLGWVILTGRASHLITRDLPGGVHVRLVASMDERIKRMVRIKNYDAVTAKNALLSADHARYRYVHTKYQHDVDDPHCYDLVINTDRLSIDLAARLVSKAVRERIQAPNPRTAAVR